MANKSCDRRCRWWPVSTNCFPIKKAGKQDFKHMIAQPSIKKDIKNRLKQCEAHGTILKN